MRPYRLRGSFVSLLLWEGHSPTVLLNVYAHLIDEFEDADRVDPEGEIARARENRSTRLVRQEAV